MKIIEHGLLPEDKIYSIRCGKCKTLFEFDFDFSEAKVTHDSRDGKYPSIACPVCQKLCTHTPWEHIDVP